MLKSLGTRLLFTCLMSAWLLQDQALGADYALLIGVKNYGKRSGLKPLLFPENDVEELAKVLIGNGYSSDNVTVMTQTRSLKEPALSPTDENILRELELILKGRGVSDSVLVAFAGHGVKYRDGRTSYFCPVNAEATTKRHLISLDTLYDKLRMCSAQHKLLLSDACRNDPLLESARSASSLTRPEPQIPSGNTIALFACHIGEEAQEDPDLKHGVFFYFILEGLRGKADIHEGESGNDGSIALVELIEFSEKSVEDYVRSKFRKSQRPEWRILGNDLDLLRDYSVTRVRQQLMQNSVGMTLRLIPAGEYSMGSSVAEPGRGQSEYEHKVRIGRPFYMQTTEVTQGQWISVVGTHPWKGQRHAKDGMDIPVTHVSWSDATEFCRKLSAKEEGDYRLPTEAEWEYACRAGSKRAYCFGDQKSRLTESGWFDQNTWDVGRKSAQSVGTKKPNAWSLHDCHGNVWEWNSDWYSETYYQSSPYLEPRGPTTGSNRVIRGGSWYSSARTCRSAFRNSMPPSARLSYVGFRVVRMIPSGR